MTINVCFKPSFIRHFNKFPRDFQDEVIEKIELFKNINNHHLLKVHKLKGKLKKFYGFSVDFQNRVVFDYISKNEAVLLMIGDHNVYK